MKTVEVYSDSICYWLRWLAVFVGFAVFYWMGGHMQGEARAVTFDVLIAGITAGAGLLAIIYRPKHFRIDFDGHELSIERLPRRPRRIVFTLGDLRYLTVRHTGHFMNLSVLCVVVRTRHGSHFFGPIYKNGIDGVTSAQVARILPRIERPQPSIHLASAKSP